MAKIDLPKRCGKRWKVREKSENFENDIEWQHCLVENRPHLNLLVKPRIFSVFFFAKKYNFVHFERPKKYDFMLFERPFTFQKA